MSYEKSPKNYEKIFLLIDKAGGVDKVYGPTLSSSEKNQIIFNIWAFFFTIFFYWKHRMWKKSLTLIFLCLVVQLVLFYLVYEVLNVSSSIALDTAINVGVAGGIFATQANLDLYKKYQMHKDAWW